jgi:DinB superfamily
MMDFNLGNSLALLERTPAIVDALLRGLPEAWTAGNEGDRTWTPIDVLAHLYYTDRCNWMPRLRLILASGESEPFPPFNRFGHLEEQQEKSADQLLDEFARLRAQNLSEVRALNLGPSDLVRRGQHPALGSATLAQLLAAWTTHDLTHLHQLTRVLAHQYRDAVGPWRRFLGVLECSGHSAPA